MNKAQVKQSKLLSLVLRHDPGKFGLTLDAAGWVDTLDLITAVKMSFEDLLAVVEDNDKKRFEFNSDGTKIRASQGHSVDVDLGYEEKSPPVVLFHGTSEKALKVIHESGGLQKMARHHVHLSETLTTAMTVASRRPPPRVFLVRAGEMQRDGHKFYLSTNGVWLVDAVPNQYLTLIDP